MPENNHEEVLARLDAMGTRLDDVVRRLERLEAPPLAPQPAEARRTGPPPIPPHIQPVPPVIQSPTAQPAYQMDEASPPQYFAGTKPFTPVHRPVPAAKDRPSDNEDLEYKIGSIWLTRGGAVAVIIGLIYLVTWVVAHHKASPLAQFCGEQLLCGVLIAIGLWKRNEREDFGQLLTGLGSCGLYLSFAGAYEYKHIFSAEALVACFVALSLLNLGFAFWRASKSFLVIGLLGGMVGAMLPMHDYNAGLDVGLHFLILVPAALVVARNRWADMSLLLWLASALALLPIYTYTGHVWELRVGALYADALVCAAVYAVSWKPAEFDRRCGGAFAMVAIAGVGGLAIEGVKHGSLHVLVLGAGATLVGTLLGDRKVGRRALMGSALATSLALVPMGADRVGASLIFGVLSIGVTVASLTFGGPVATGEEAVPGAESTRGNSLLALAGFEFILGLGAYIGLGTMNTPQPTQGVPPLAAGPELWILAVLTATIVVGCFGWYRRGAPKDACVAVGFVVFTSLFERFGFVALTGNGACMPGILAGFATTTTLMAILLVFARQFQLRSALACVWVTFGIQFCIYLGFLSDSSYTIALEVALLASLAVLALLATWQTASRVQNERSLLIGAAGVWVGIALLRAGFIVLPAILGFTQEPALAAAAAVWFALACLLTYAVKWPSMLANAWIAFCILWVEGLAVPFGALNDFTVAKMVPGETVFQLLALVAAFILAHATLKTFSAGAREKLSIQTPIVVLGFMVEALLFRLGYHELPLRTGFTPMAGLTVGGLAAAWGAIALFRKSNWTVAVVLGWAGLLVGLGAILPMAWMEVGERGARHEIGLLFAAFATTLVVARDTASKTKERVVLTGAVVLIEWLAFWHFVWSALRPLRLDDSAIATIAWTAFAAVLIGVGFRYQARYVRYWALSLFGLVIGKALFYDMAELDTGFKIAIFLFLGLCMIGGGYAYIRVRTPRPVT